MKDIAFITTLSGYVHWKLTGEKVLGIGDASGMFPIDSETNAFDAEMMEKFDALHADKGFPWKLGAILPAVRTAGGRGRHADGRGREAARPDRHARARRAALPAGGRTPAPAWPRRTACVCAPATSRPAPRSSRWSCWKKALSKVHMEIDMVTTPTGRPVAMVHCNNCTSDINAWAALFKSFAEAIGAPCSMPLALDTLFYKALEGDPDCGGLVAYNYFSGEPITGMEEGRPLFARLPDSRFSLANFARTQLYSAMATLKIGMDILIEQEHAAVDSLLGHGGFFKAKGVGQKLMAGALHTPVSVMETAGEGGPWGMALLAAYRVNGAGETLEDYLDRHIFAGSKAVRAEPIEADMAGFEKFLDSYKRLLPPAEARGGRGPALSEQA